MKRAVVGLAGLTLLVLGFVADAQAQGKLAVLFHGARGGPRDFLIRNQSSFERAGFSTVVVSSAEAGSAAAKAARQRGQRVYFVAMSRLAAVQMGVLELHIWGSRIDKVDQPDRIVFDLDPDPSVGFDAAKQAAYRLRDVLAALDLESFALLTGGKGIHVIAPIQRRHEWPQVKGFARAVAERLAEDAPDRYVATMSKAKRKGRIFIDFFRNDRTATAVAPYSTRKHAGAPLAWPVGWRELDGITAANQVTIEQAARLLRRADPWKDYGKLRQGLKVSALRALGL